MRVMTFGLRSEGVGSQGNRVNYKQKEPMADDVSVKDFDVRNDEFSRRENVDVTRQVHRNASFQQIIQSVMERLKESTHVPPQEIIQKERPRKVEVAQKLTDWMMQTLESNGIQLAVVTRQGGLQHKKYDKTGMFHSGLALFHPREKKWKIYNLIDEKIGGQWHCDVQWTDPKDFFYQQGGYQAKSLLLVPDQETQERISQALLNGAYKKLLFTNDYHLVSDPASSQSLNCNKWVLLNVLAAQMQNYNPNKLLTEIEANYQSDLIEIHPLLRLFAWSQPHVKSAEIPWLAPIRTVTVNSLLESGLFERTFTCDAEEHRETQRKVV